MWQDPLLWVALALLGSAAVAFALERARPAAVLLLGGAAALRVLAARLDPFLNTWDEQFHALVARNLATHPLLPTLHDVPVLPHAAGEWVSAHVWLHKPPLALWAMAASVRMLGPSELAVRLPSVLFATLTVAAVYGLGTIACGRRVGWVAAFMLATARFPLELVSGAEPTDHVDVAFVGLVTGSLLCLLAYVAAARRLALAIGMGALAGAAVLTKWMPGLLVLGCWAALLVLVREHRTWSEVRRWLLALAIAGLFVIPWELFAAARFPLEHAAERAHAGRHLSEALEGHAGDLLWHVRELATVYGRIVPWVLVPALLVLWRRVRTAALRWALLSPVLVTYGVFSAAATKMPAYPLIASGPIYVALACVADAVVRPVARVRRVGPAVAAALVIALGVAGLSLPVLARRHDDARPSAYRAAKLHNAEVFRALRALPMDRPTVLLGCPELEEIPAMFYTGLPAYGPASVEDVARVNAAGYRAVVFGGAAGSATRGADLEVLPALWVPPTR